MQVIKKLPNGGARVWWIDWGDHYDEDVPASRLRRPPAVAERTKPADEVRPWTDQEGKQVTAKFVSFRDNIVRLKSDHDKIIPIPYDSLSDDDQKAVRRIAKEGKLAASK